MYPNITLKIQDFIPAILFNPEEGISRQMTLAQENILELIEDIAIRLKLVDEILAQIKDKEVKYANLLEIARSADEIKFGQYAQINTQKVEFELADSLKALLEEGLSSQDNFDELEDIPLEVLRELARNQNADLFASLLDALYNILIAKTLLAASEIGVEKIKLIDDHKSVRLQEKMAKELDKMGLELIVG